LENIQEGSVAYKEELFGPVFSLYRVKNERHAMELANDTEYGLGAAVFCKDIERAEKFARGFDAGMVYVNDFVQSQSDVPSGGTKDSGHGKECYKDGLLELTNRKCIVIAN